MKKTTPIIVTDRMYYPHFRQNGAITEHGLAPTGTRGVYLGTKNGYAVVRLDAHIDANLKMKKRTTTLHPNSIEIDRTRIKRVGALGTPGAFGYYSRCPHCGGRIADVDRYHQGYGSQGSGHVDQECKNCGWRHHVTYD